MVGGWRVVPITEPVGRRDTALACTQYSASGGGSTTATRPRSSSLAWRSPPAPCSQFTCTSGTTVYAADELDVALVAAVLPL